MPFAYMDKVTSFVSSDSSFFPIPFDLSIIFSSLPLSLGTLEVKLINVQYQYQTIDKKFQIGITNAQFVRDAVIEAIINANYTIPADNNFTGFVLEKADGTEVIGKGASVTDQEALLFYSPDLIVPTSGNRWTKQKLLQLGMKTVPIPVDEFFKKYHNIEVVRPANLSKSATDLIIALSKVDLVDVTSKIDFSNSAELRDITNPEFALYRHPLVKALFLTWKYPNHESMVDSLTMLLLKELGYFSGVLFALQQFRLPLLFGGGQYRCESIADFLVMDLVSYYKMAVLEDKSVNEKRTESLPQLVAESIALFQCNVVKEEEISGGPAGKYFKTSHGQESKSSSSLDTGRLPVESKEEMKERNGSDHVIGIRVNGTVFHFYSIEISDAVRGAMRTLKPSRQETKIIQIGKPQGYDFWNLEDRNEVILLLDYFRDIITLEGSRGARYASFT